MIPPVSFAQHNTDPQGFAEALGASFRRYGFAVVSDHGLDQALIDGALERTKAFFALPEQAKRAYHVPGQAARGATPPSASRPPRAPAERDLKEFWHIGRELPPGHPYRRYMPDNLWPTEVEGFRPHLQGLYEALDALGLELLRAIADYLDLPRDWFDDKVKLGNSVLRLLHYPPVSAEASGVRAGAHEDINVITLLLGAEEAGLEILARDEGGEARWIPVAPPPGAVVCNIGDMLQRLTNHVLPSTTHRVVNPPPERRGVSRYSTPFFLHFEPEFEIRTLPGCLGAGGENRYPEPITAEAYLQQRLQEIKLA
jgi:isopenicillin N synthase-like dioxygenase